MSKNISLYDLTAPEKAIFKKNKIRLQAIKDLQVAELQTILSTSETRAMEIYALSEFQSVPSIGIRFAEDLIAMKYYSLHQLKDKNGAGLIHELEMLRGYWLDPCVEDQCRLVVYFANTKDNTKRWWDFTGERKTFRAEHGYPADRPHTAWFETLGLMK